MFTGLVEGQGTLAARSRRGPGSRLTIAAALPGDGWVLGESVAIDGVCLTVDAFTETSFDADASEETLARSTLAGLAVGAAVNLERAVPLGGRMGGHMVSGHIDGVARLVERRARGAATELAFTFPHDWAKLIAEKGSIAVNGVSLTVNSVDGERFRVVVIPHTRARTTLTGLHVGDAANVELDVIARYVARLLTFGAACSAKASPNDSDATLLEQLGRAGYL